jgi:protein-S-isoprenylcysteine O-methyltransferase Ste14
VTLLRHVAAVTALPFTVTIIIPLWIQGWTIPRFALVPDTRMIVQLLGGAALIIGLALFTASVSRFARDGRGTLAPWDPPRRLVVTGPYRHVRNPMISGVLFLLAAEAALALSPALARWAVIFLAINLIYIPLLEEPQLDQRFGASYREYRRHVRRFLPRLTPWVQPPVGEDPAAR